MVALESVESAAERLVRKMDRFNPFKIPKTNRAFGAIRTATVFFRPVIKPWDTDPSDWLVVKLSGDRTGYVKTSDLRFA